MDAIPCPLIYLEFSKSLCDISFKDQLADFPLGVISGYRMVRKD